ncbi:MAG TPA: lasso peptide biosynthesis B2 protein [Vicinamibacterales bacterium]|nr:lasso peptide biosynthesis B2 protein [Vicinamibacterales bacterium]
MIGEAALVLAATRLGLSVARHVSVERRLARWAHCHPVPQRDQDTVARVVRVVRGISRRLPGMTCLVQALAAQAMLARRGVRARVHIGVRPGSALAVRLDAHAWLTASDGRVLIGDVPDLDSYQPLESASARITRQLAALVRGERVAWAALDTEPDALVAFCEREDMTGLVHRAIARGPAADWPAACVDRLARRARLDAALELARGQEIRRVLDALGRAGVRALIFKGTALAYSRYAHPVLRPRSDTDLLISREQLDAARIALTALGYAAAETSGGDVLFRQLELHRADQHGVVHAFDVHWRISNQERFARMFDDDELWQRAEPVEALGPHARAAGAADALLISCVHPVMHHRNDDRLIWNYDTHVIASAMDASQWSSFVELAKAKAVAAVCVHGLELARAQFGTVVPASASAALENAARELEPAAAYLMPGRSWRDDVAANFRAMPDWRARLRLLREMALPSPTYMRRAYSLDRSTLGWILLPALYAHRGLKAAGRK